MNRLNSALASSAALVLGIASVTAAQQVPGDYYIRNGCGDLLPPQSLLMLQGAPVLGQQMVLGIDNPLGTQSPGSLPLAAISTSPLSGGECGALIPGWGMPFPGAPGELMVFPPIIEPLLVGTPWNGLEPAQLPVFLPPLPQLAGFELHLQGVMFDPFAPALNGQIGLTEAMTMTLGTQGPAFHASIEDLQFGLPQTQAFALRFHDELTGQPLPLQFIEDPFLVNQMVNAIGDPFAAHPGGAYHDATQELLLRLFSGEIMTLEIADVELPGEGTIQLSNGWMEPDPLMAGVIETSYGITGYSTLKEKEKEKKVPNTSTWTDEALETPSTKEGTFTEIKLIIYQDNPGSTLAKDYADGQAAAEGVEAYESKGPNDVVNHIKDLYDQCIKVKTLVFAVHGSPGSFRLGPKTAPFKGPSRVGRHDGQVARSDFAARLKPYLSGGEIKMFSCNMAEDGGTNATDGPEVLQEMADAACVPVEGATKKVTVNDDNECETAGAVMTATPSGGSPATTTAAPAGELDPCD